MNDREWFWFVWYAWDASNTYKYDLEELSGYSEDEATFVDPRGWVS